MELLIYYNITYNWLLHNQLCNTIVNHNLKSLPNRFWQACCHIHLWHLLSGEEALPWHTYICKTHIVLVQSCMARAVNQSQHLLKSYAMELLYRKEYFTESRPKLLILGSLFLEDLASHNLLRVKNEYGSWKEEGSNNYNSPLICKLEYMKMCFKSCLPFKICFLPPYQVFLCCSFA